MIKRSSLILAFAMLLLLFSLPAAAGEPSDMLKAPMDEALALLRDPKYNSDDAQLKAQQREEFWAIVAPVFDFSEVSKRTLARNWRKFDDAQQAEFAQVFSELLGNIYVDRIQGGYSDESIEFGKETIHESKPLARVSTFIVSSRNRIPVDYSLMKKDGAWRVYDVKVEGVSLVKNYRSQFKEILSKETPDQLIERLKQKVIEQEAKFAQG